MAALRPSWSSETTNSTLVAVMVVLAGELAARGDGDDLDRAGEVVGVLLEPAPGLIHLYGRRTVIQDDPLSLTASLAHPWWEPKTANFGLRGFSEVRVAPAYPVRGDERAAG